MGTKKVCATCGSDNVHYIEFRMDYSHPRDVHPLNEGTEPIDERDLPYYLEGHYCHNCGKFCSTKVEYEYK